MNKKPEPLNYERRKKSKPSSPPMSAYERNGWIGLVITLIVCAVAAWLGLSFLNLPPR